MRIYIDNNLISGLYDSREAGFLTPNTQLEMENFERLAQSTYVELLLSEESLAEIRKTSNVIVEKGLEKIYSRMKGSKPVIRNSRVIVNDDIATYDSPDVTYNHDRTDTDLNRVHAFLSDLGNTNVFDARYITNSLLAENRIDFFITLDKASLWKHRIAIEEKFGVKVRLPSEVVPLLPPLNNLHNG